MIERYFDYAATTPIEPRVVAEMQVALTQDFGNANSLHGFGQRAHRAVEVARERLASLIGAEDPQQIFFTSGATEANNWVASMFDEDAWLSPFEHDAMREPAIERGWRVLENDGLNLEMPATSRIVSVIGVNNELGFVLEPSPAPGLRHSDITQQVGKLPVDLAHLDFASMSGHKFYGPKGIGALYCRDWPSRAFLMGGGQEQGFRAGTLNVPAIVGMGAAAAIAGDEMETDYLRATEIRGLLTECLAAISDTIVYGPEFDDRVEWSPYILAVSFAGLEGESAVIELDRLGFAVSSGAACSTGSTEPSHVLQALGVEAEFLRGTVRLSFGRYSNLEAAQAVGRQIATVVDRLRRMK